MKIGNTFCDITGQRFGELEVIKVVDQNQRKLYRWLCRCSCGNTKIFVGAHLRYGNVRSCGCLRRERNLAGEKFGRLEVIKYIGKNHRGSHVWECLCECGNKKIATVALLRFGQVKSCGCLHVKVNSRESEDGYFRNYKTSAKDRGFSFRLSKNQFIKITRNNCYYCGSHPRKLPLRKPHHVECFANGIDRINSQHGYSIKNCVACCSVCNRMKGVLTKQDFIEHATKISLNLSATCR